jgi:hypothetical protein
MQGIYLSAQLPYCIYAPVGVNLGKIRLTIFKAGVSKYGVTKPVGTHFINNSSN